MVLTPGYQGCPSNHASQFLPESLPMGLELSIHHHSNRSNAPGCPRADKPSLEAVMKSTLVLGYFGAMSLTRSVGNHNPRTAMPKGTRESICSPEDHNKRPKA